MIAVEYNFTPDLEQVDFADFAEETAWFVNAISKNGKIARSYLGGYRTGSSIQYFCEIFEKDSLQTSLYSKPCADHYSKILAWSAVSPSYRLLGEVADAPKICGCSHSSHYILMTAAFESKTPIRCGDCEGLVPLYRLALMPNEQDFNGVFYWEEMYQAFDRLFILSGAGEKFGYRQMSDAKSKLTQLGFKICKMLEQANQPFYYFLYKFYSKHKNTCPLCGGQWKLKRSGKVDLRCDICKLAASSSEQEKIGIL